MTTVIIPFRTPLDPERARLLLQILASMPNGSIAFIGDNKDDMRKFEDFLKPMLPEAIKGDESHRSAERLARAAVRAAIMAVDLTLFPQDSFEKESLILSATIPTSDCYYPSNPKPWPPLPRRRSKNDMAFMPKKVRARRHYHV